MTRPDPLQLPETAGDAYHVGFADGAMAQPRWRVILAVSFAIGVAIALIFFALGYAARRTDASDFAVSSSAGCTSPDHAGVTSGPELLTATPAETPRVPVDRRSAAPPSPDPGTTAPPAETWTRQGSIAWADPSHGPAYLAIPLGPGHLVEVCGPRGCLRLVSTDAGPDLEMQRAGRIADLAVGLWERIAGVGRGQGLTVGSWTVVVRD